MYKSIVIFPRDGHATVDGILRDDLNFSVFSELQDIHVLKLDTEAGTGLIEYVITGEYRPEENLRDISKYSDVVNYVSRATDASVNPCLFYATGDVLVGDMKYFKTEIFECNKYPRRTTPPTGFTDVAPVGDLNKWQEWFWSGTEWVMSPFPLTYTLPEGKDFMKKLLKKHYNDLINEQLREYNMWELSQDFNLENFTPADSAVHGYSNMLLYDNVL